MKVLHVIPSISPRQGGPSHAIAMMVSALVSRGCEVELVTSDNHGPDARYLAGDAPAYGGVTMHMFRQVTPRYTATPGAVPWLWHNVRRFDVVHVHALFSFLPVVAALIARMRGVRYVVRPLGTLARYGLTTRRPWLKRLSLGLLERPIVDHALAVHCTSDAEAGEVHAVAPRCRTVVCPLAVGDELFALPRSAVDDLPSLLFLSRLDRKKNPDMLLRAFALVSQRDARVRLRIAGAGDSEYVSNLRKLACDLGIDERVDWLGHVTGVQKLVALSEAMLFVLPSESENFGIAVAEALAAGVPCLVSAGVALSPEIVASRAGELVETAPGPLADAICGWLSDGSRRLAAGAAARELARQRYASGVLADNLLAMYGSTHGL